MRAFVIFCFLLIALVAFASGEKGRSKGTKEERRLFRKWVKEHNKKYKSHAEAEAAFDKLLKNHRESEEHNKLHDQKKASFRRGLWEHSDLTHEERRKRLGGAVTQDPSGKRTTRGVSNPEFPAAPDSINWVEKGLVGPVLNQDPCGSCWAFGSAGVVEAVLRRNNGSTTQISPQQLVDCATNGESILGCDGGWPYAALEYVRQNGITSLSEYPYVGYEQDTCDYSPEEKVTSVEFVNQLQMAGDEEYLKKAVASVGPTIINICLADTIYDYKTGVYLQENCCAPQKDGKVHYHAPLLVGYGTDPEGGDYWLVKNSWGPSWGEGGYIKMARGKNNMCEVANFGTYAK